MRPGPFPPQLAIVVLALVIAAVAEVASFAGIALSYVVAWVVVNAALALGIALPALDRRRMVVTVALVVIAPTVAVASRMRALAEHEGLIGIEASVGDRLRLERSPAIHPDLVRSDHPQRYFVRAGGASRVRITIAPGARAIDAVSLGHGVFRVDYDPRTHGAPSATGDVQARIEVDGAVHERAMEVIAPLAHPRWLRANADRTRACTTSEETDELVVIDARGLVLRRVLDDAPSDCAWLGARVVVVFRHASALALVDPSSDVVERVEIGLWGHRVAVSDDTSRIAVAHEDGRVSMIDAASHEVTRAEVRGLADWVVIVEDAVIVARRAPAALFRIVNGRVVRTRTLAAPAVTMTRGVDGSIVLATTDWTEEFTPPAHLGNHYVQDQIAELDARTFETRRMLPTAHRSPRQDAAGGLDRGVSPIGIDVAPDGRWTIAFAGSDEIATLDPARGLAPHTIDVASLGVGAPISAVVLEGATIAASSAAGGRVVLLDARSGRPRETIALAPDDATLLRDGPDALRRRFGERAFYEGTRAGISCQSCHLHGASDGLAHNIGGQVLAPTLDVRGVRGTAPYLRDGSYPRIGDLHEVADTLYRGFRETAGDRAATLEAWIASLPPPLPLAPGDLEAQRHGLDVFVRAGCPDCHAMPAASGLGRHPIASVFPDAEAPADLSLDAPSLRGTGRRSRWLFDGRAHTLGAIFIRENGADRHGHTRGRSSVEIADLVRFLESM
ncbi:hypothetical protein [Sandaracinus amylolyticus]|uniref:Cytochrome c551 peroxidase n=1 Tax=Sandaracinus amylolyticus TaxID=927083 RepID=A0A0F6VZD1_9BACT|nr:hypothetical protein [Sandaracinus amylolyticus]AKF03492.1 Cytochrome c551 peroxidase [Sandaracinus amylolyticus]